MSEIDDIIKQTLNDLEAKIIQLDKNYKNVKANCFEIETCNGFLKSNEGAWFRIEEIRYLYCELDPSDDSWHIWAEINGSNYSLYQNFISEKEAQACLDTLITNLYNDEE